MSWQRTARSKQQVGKPLSNDRWRGNIWLDGPAAWDEFDWIGRTLRIGTAELEVRERITRCMATTANPDTGQRDADTLGALQSGWNHRDFGVYGVVTQGGTGPPWRRSGCCCDTAVPDC